MAEKHTKGKVIVGMSGGVDSSVAAFLLLEQGYDVVGATIVTGYGRSSEQAAHICHQLGIEHYLLEATEQFRDSVIRPFVSEYCLGRTPNPCVQCNASLKFPLFLPLMERLNASYLATGHYVRKAEYQGRLVLRRAAAKHKDQSYFMYRLSQDILQKALFPLGEYSKEQVRHIAACQGLASAEQKDSYDICFIEDGNYRSCIEEFAEKPPVEGDILDKYGNIVGQHRGLTNYTLGQRRGVDIALGYPAYVIAINYQRNRLILGERDDLLTKTAKVRELSLLAFEKMPQTLTAQVCIRYQAQQIPALLTAEGDGAKIDFLQPVWAVTPGQSAVFYDEDLLLGGGILI
jgi:tRNA-specific 2-thiouridylase